jgi:hypothetical protein
MLTHLDLMGMKAQGKYVEFFIELFKDGDKNLEELM